MQTLEIFPSLISGDILSIRKQIEEFEPLCDGFHIDIMDGCFAPNLAFGIAFVNAVVSATRLPIHTHWMVRDPAFWIERCALRPIDFFTFHVEAYSDHTKILSTLKMLQSKNIKTGLALKPKTEASVLKNYFSLVDQVLIMSVEPGFSGQKFMPAVNEKIDEVVLLKRLQSLPFSVALDGGVRASALKGLMKQGVTQCAMASAIFSSPSPLEALRSIHMLAKDINSSTI